MDSDIPLGTCALYTLEPTAKKFKIGEIGVSRKDIFQQLLTLASEFIRQLWTLKVREGVIRVRVLYIYILCL